MEGNIEKKTGKIDFDCFAPDETGKYNMAWQALIYSQQRVKNGAMRLIKKGDVAKDMINTVNAQSLYPYIQRVAADQNLLNERVLIIVDGLDAEKGAIEMRYELK
jgi:stress response protein SCP2